MAKREGIGAGPGEMMGNVGPGILAGLRVIEVADERAEYTGLLLAGLGAEVVKIEPPEGNATRRIGPRANTCCACSPAPTSCSMPAAAR